jgi:hypothetical protein
LVAACAAALEDDVVVAFAAYHQHRRFEGHTAAAAEATEADALAAALLIDAW